jgi:hypothetical protein
VLAPGGVPASYGAVPPPPAPPAGPGYSPQAFGGGYPSAPPPSGGGSGKVVALVAVAVLVLVLLGIGGFFGIRALTGDDDTAAADDTTVPASSEPTETASSELTAPTAPTPPPSSQSAQPTDQQCKGGIPTPTRTPRDTHIIGGGLAIPVPDGYTADTTYSTVFTWADDFTPLEKTIEEGKAVGWVSIYGVGALCKANGFDDPAQAAETVMACMAGSADLYQDFTGRTDVTSGAITVDHKDAYQLVSELRVDNPDLDVDGDVAEVIVVDTGDPETFGLFITVVPIGDQQLIDQQTAFTDQIRVR